LEDLEKELDESCNCCNSCNCGDDCHSTEDNKCCDDCTCDESCECHCNKNCDNEQLFEENSDCDINHSCDENCNCAEQEDVVHTCEEDIECDIKSNEETIDDNQSEDVNESEIEDDKCQCGCGENVEGETTADSYFKQLLGLRAEFDNYRKRSQADIAKAYSNGFNQAITEFLPALDSFKMATEYITDPNTLMGIQYIEKGILSTLEKMGIEVIDATGKFDPNFHQAIGSEMSSEHESGDIVKECFKGFKMGEKVIRYSQVIVAK
jgi:molecular chaperone GrpE